MDPAEQGRHYVYLAVEAGGGGSPYVGYTTEPHRRLRQHRRELAGGAERTAKMDGDVEMAVVVGGFLCQRDALHFEWAWAAGNKRRPSKLAPAAATLAPATASVPFGSAAATTATTPPKTVRAPHIQKSKSVGAQKRKKRVEVKEEEEKEEEEDGEEEESGGKEDEAKDAAWRAAVASAREAANEGTAGRLRPWRAPLRRLVQRLFALLACERWTRQAIPTQSPWRLARACTLTVTWFDDPRIPGRNFDPGSAPAALPVRHLFSGER